jgi:hypothetical protein
MRSAMYFPSWALGLLLVGMCANGPAWSQSGRPNHEEIGAWVLSCPVQRIEPCLLRHRDWVLPPDNAGPSVALEVQMRGDSLVPVVTLRGLPTASSLGGSLVLDLVITLSFDGDKPLTLLCGSSGSYYACAPAPAALQAIAAILPKARVLQVDMSLTIPGFMALPRQRRSMDLSGTPQALGRLLAVGPGGESLPAFAGLDLRGFLDRILHATGYDNGMADVVPLLLSLVIGSKR